MQSAERPWSQSTTATVDAELIESWTAALDELPYPTVGFGRTEPLAPGLSIVVLDLDDLDGLSVDGRRDVELVIVLTSAGRPIVEAFRTSHPELDVRTISLPTAHRAAARVAGLAAARRAQVREAGENGTVVETALAQAIARQVGGAEDVYWANVAVRTRTEFVAGTPDDDAGWRPHLAAIAQLEELRAEAGAAMVAPIDEAIAARATAIGTYLQRHPSEHAELVAALDELPIFHLPYGLVNAGMPRGVVFAYAFAPYADASGIVMAKRIRTMGRVADVVYNAMDRIRTVDPTTRRIAGPFTADEAVIATPTYFSHWPAMEQFILEGLDQARKWEAEKGPYRWSYSRAHFAASHLLGAAHKLASPSVSWTAEFSDPLSRDMLDEERGTTVEPGPVRELLTAGLEKLGLPMPASDNCFVWCEELAYVLADELIFTNENQLEYMLSYCSDPLVAATARAKAVVSAHPTLPTPFYSMVDGHAPLEPGKAHVAYFGVFYPTRGLDDVLAAAAELGPADRERLMLHVFTTKPETLRARAAELGIGACVRVGPYAGYLEFLNLTTRFDCLVVNDANTSEHHERNPYLPSKWSDYKGSGTAVWGLVEPDSPLSRQPLAYQSPVGDAATAKAVLERIVRARFPSA
ncbi:glycosyltransferase family protein [Tenggerimyces flavus]|uniref:Uncharacterized protein n=1 Tax=Tenggerimyces flavus TaxID=1708749 RepID=A0ABV7YH94_9ACTN|nr:hypothetical protein [Tenggerimyces flavus]MBM7789833.1 hypothetical protein [Tenggerimyces flavus]